MESQETRLTRENYAANVRGEWKRLVMDPFHQLEFRTTLAFLKQYLPGNGLILDAGGGPGRYTLELAAWGYNMVLLDLVTEHLELAKKHLKKAQLLDKIKAFIPGTITDLCQFPDNSFDAVLCLGGPLSHVHPEAERQKAVGELARVAKPGAPIFTSVMSKYGVMLATPLGWPQEIADRQYIESVIATGDDYRWRGNGYCHFFTCGELEKLFLDENLEAVAKVGLEGLNVDNKATNKFARQYPLPWKNWLEIHLQICRDPFVVEASSHMMIIARKP